MKAPEGGRVVKISVLITTGVNNDGYRELLGKQLATSKSVKSWIPDSSMTSKPVVLAKST